MGDEGAHRRDVGAGDAEAAGDPGGERALDLDRPEPAVEVTPRGSIAAPAGPGMGCEPDIDRIEALTERREELT